MSIRKGILLRHMESNDLEAIVSLARSDRKIVSLLVRLAFDKETLVGWRAIKAVGLIAREIVATDVEFLRETCRKLLWSLSDESGGIGWAAPELLGEIVSSDPKRFADIVPLIAQVYDVEEDVFRSGVLYALSLIGEKAPELVLRHADVVLKGLSEANPLARVFALQALLPLLPFLGGSFLDEVKNAVQKLASDTAETWVYEGDNFITVDVGQEARDVIKLMDRTP
jgi:HEAT repeat protein